MTKVVYMIGFRWKKFMHLIFWTLIVLTYMALLQYEYSNLKSQKYCGKTSPQDGGWIRTDAPVVKVTFITDLTEEKAGFQIEYKFKSMMIKSWYVVYNTNLFILIGVRCGTLTGNLDNGKIVLSNDRGYHEFEDVIRFNCNEGYRIVGNKFITCQNNGKWSGQIPQCEGGVIL